MAPTRIYAFCRELSGTELHLLLQLHRLSVRLESIGNVVVALVDKVLVNVTVCIQNQCLRHCKKSAQQRYTVAH